MKSKKPKKEPVIHIHKNGGERYGQSWCGVRNFKGFFVDNKKRPKKVSQRNYKIATCKTCITLFNGGVPFKWTDEKVLKFVKTVTSGGYGKYKGKRTAADKMIVFKKLNSKKRK